MPRFKLPRYVETAYKAQRRTKLFRKKVYDIFYDTKLQEYVIANFPKKKQQFEVRYIVRGPARIRIGNQKYKIRIK